MNMEQATKSDKVSIATDIGNGEKFRSMALLGAFGIERAGYLPISPSRPNRRRGIGAGTSPFRRRNMRNKAGIHV